MLLTLLLACGPAPSPAVATATADAPLTVAPPRDAASTAAPARTEAWMQPLTDYPSAHGLGVVSADTPALFEDASFQPLLQPGPSRWSLTVWQEDGSPWLLSAYYGPVTALPSYYDDVALPLTATELQPEQLSFTLQAASDTERLCAAVAGQAQVGAWQRSPAREAPDLTQITLARTGEAWEARFCGGAMPVAVGEDLPGALARWKQAWVKRAIDAAKPAAMAETERGYSWEGSAVNCQIGFFQCDPKQAQVYCVTPRWIGGKGAAIRLAPEGPAPLQSVGDCGARAPGIE